MGRNKIEKEFSDKLSTREINPSAAAWDRLDAMLTTAEMQKKPRRNYWLFVAAALVGIALFSSLFLLSGNDIKTVDTSSAGVAETESIPTTKQSDSVDAPEIQIAKVARAETVTPATGSKQNQIQPRHQKQMLAVNQIPEKSIEPLEPEVQSSIEKQSIPKQSTKADDIPESLLAAIKSKTESQKTSVVKVNATDLLQNVDKRPEPTKRQRFLKTVQNVKVAVENRNLEENQ